MIREYRIEIVGSIFLHLLLLGVLAASPSCVSTAEKKEKITIIKAVSMTTVKKSRLPNRASKAPREATTAPTKDSVTKPPKPPEMKTKPEQMVIKKEERKPEKKEEKKPEPQKEKEPEKVETKPEKEPEKQSNKQSREELMRKLAKENALKALENAPEGPVDREASSPDGSEKAKSGSSAVGPTDPVLSAYVEASRNAILPNWTPLPSIIAAHPEYEVVIKVEVLEDGTMRNPKIIKKSGDSSFDRAAIMAIHKTIRIPPPPEKWKSSAKSGIIITLAAQDK